MWQRGSGTEVTCIACGESVPRSKAREYDKHGDRWDREDKEFEHLCKPCYRTLCHQPRKGLESLLSEAGAGAVTQSEFLQRFSEAVDAEADSENERGSQQ
ncbi:DUF7562 family protein [Natronomonas sp.]|uniref:DUF7562 family protein n=1 Tax=Natronomonas sp. TaxID=2184060 RepID=UPI002FC39604